VFTDSSEIAYYKEMWDELCVIMNDVGFSEEVTPTFVFIGILSNITYVCILKELPNFSKLL